MVGTSLLDNRSAVSASAAPPLAVTTGPNPLIRTSRFGFDQVNGISREFSHADPAAPGFAFLGRFTLEEMSNLTFNYPQNPSPHANFDPSAGSFGNPLSYIDYPAASDAGPFPDGTIDDFAGGDRRGQDLLLSNVHAFEIELWDDRLGRFIQPGHSLTAGPVKGDFHRDRNLHSQLPTPLLQVPGDPAAWAAGHSARWGHRVFDTWHMQNDLDGTGGPLPPLPPPYRPMTYYPPGSPDGPYPSRGIWQPSTTYASGDRIFPQSNLPQDFSFYYLCVLDGVSPPNEDLNGNGLLDLGEDTNNNSVLDGEPEWPTVSRAIHYGNREDKNQNGTLDAGEDFNGNGSLDGEPNWIAVRNVQPLRAIRIRVRFYHEASARMRQVTIVHSLTDENTF